MWPETPPLWRRMMELLAELYCPWSLFPDLGLRLAQTVRSTLPSLVQSGLAREAELDVETLVARLEAEAVRLDCQLIGPTQLMAWV
jgi:hypothetical protein